MITESLSDLASATISDVDDSTDPAEVVTLASLRVIRLAYTEPDFARLIVNIGHSEALFGGAAMHPPHARVAVERGVASGRFEIADLEVLLTTVIGAAFALIREILDGRHNDHAERAFARHILAMLGLTPAEAKAVVTKVAKSERS